METRYQRRSNETTVDYSSYWSGLVGHPPGNTVNYLHALWTGNAGLLPECFFFESLSFKRLGMRYRGRKI